MSLPWDLLLQATACTYRSAPAVRVFPTLKVTQPTIWRSQVCGYAV